MKAEERARKLGRAFNFSQVAREEFAEEFRQARREALEEAAQYHREKSDHHFDKAQELYKQPGEAIQDALSKAHADAEEHFRALMEKEE